MSDKREERIVSDVLRRIKIDRFIPADKSQFPLYLRVARKYDCLNYIHELAIAIDGGEAFFKDARSRLIIDKNEGKHFCSFLNEVYSKKDNVAYLCDAERTLRISVSRLLLFVAGRAVRSSWFRNVSYESLKRTITTRPLPFGNEYDVSLLVLSWIEWNRPFSKYPEKIVNLIVELYAVLIDDEFMSEIAVELAKQSLAKAFTLSCFAKSLLQCSTALTKSLPTDIIDDENFTTTVGLLDSTIDKELLIVLLSRCWRYLMIKRSQRLPDHNTVTRSRLFLQNNMLFEYNSYVGTYRLIALPPPKVKPSDSFEIIASSDTCLFSIHSSSQEVYRLDLSKVATPLTLKNYFLGTSPYPCHVWKFIGKTLDMRGNVFTDGESTVNIQTNVEQPSKWRVTWKRGENEDGLDFTVLSPISEYCCHIYAILNGHRLLIVGASNLGKSLMGDNVEYVLDLITHHFTQRDVNPESKMIRTFHTEIPDTASCESLWSAGNPVLIKNLSGYLLPLCLGEFKVPSSREGFWVCDDPARTHIEQLNGLDWRKSGKFNLHERQSSDNQSSSAMNVDQDECTLAAVYNMRRITTENDILTVTKQFESIELMQ